MHPTLRHSVLGLAKFLLVVVVSVSVGAGLGIGLSELGGRGASDNPPVAGGPSSAAPPPAQDGATGTTGVGDPKRATVADPPQAPRIRVLSNSLRSAITASGQRRRRARLVVRVRVTARADATDLGVPRLISGDNDIEVDPDGKNAAGPLLEPIAAGRSATGDLRFETAGDLTDRLVSQQRATLRMAGRSVSLTIDAGDAETAAAPSDG